MTKYCKNPQDWEEGCRPIAWPQLRYQAEFLGLSERRTQELNRALQEAGIFVMRDDPQGRRYVRVPVDRDHQFRWKMITQSGGR